MSWTVILPILFYSYFWLVFFRNERVCRFAGNKWFNVYNRRSALSHQFMYFLHVVFFIQSVNQPVPLFEHNVLSKADEWTEHTPTNERTDRYTRTYGSWYKCQILCCIVYSMAYSFVRTIYSYEQRVLGFIHKCSRYWNGFNIWLIDFSAHTYPIRQYIIWCKW